MSSFSTFSQSKMYAEDCENGEVVFRDSYGNEPKETFINGKLEGFYRGKV
nr:hypothetical protein [Leptospira borgpetersenii]